MVVVGLLVLFGGVLAWIGALRQVRLVPPTTSTRPGSAARAGSRSAAGPAVAARTASGVPLRRRWRLQGPRWPGWLGGTVLGLGAGGFALAALDAGSWPHGLVALGLAVAASARLTVWLRGRRTR